MDRDLGHCTGGRDQDHPQEKEMQKGKMVVWGGLTNSWLSEEALQIAEKRREKKGKGEKKRYLLTKS